MTGENLCHERPDYLQAVMMTAGAHGAKSNELTQIVQNNFNMVPNDSQMVINIPKGFQIMSKCFSLILPNHRTLFEVKGV